MRKSVPVEVALVPAVVSLLVAAGCGGEPWWPMAEVGVAAGGVARRQQSGTAGAGTQAPVSDDASPVPTGAPEDGGLAEPTRVEAASDADAGAPSGSLCPSDLPAASEAQDVPRAIATRGRLEARFCGSDDIDVYAFGAPVPTGAPFSVRVRFSSFDGDIDLRLLDAVTGEVLDESATTLDEEVVHAVSTGAPFLAEVVLFEAPSAAGVAYSLEFLRPLEATNDCCEVSTLPGCAEASVRQCVCDIDAYCCSHAHDGNCAALAASECGAQCRAARTDQDCCLAGPGAGCQDPGVESCVCALLPFCCIDGYSDLCRDAAIAQCGAQCGPQTSQEEHEEEP